LFTFCFFTAGVAQTLGLIFFTKKTFSAIILVADFLINSSGHPDCCTSKSSDDVRQLCKIQIIAIACCLTLKVQQYVGRGRVQKQALS
jgi:hypothetical protein